MSIIVMTGGKFNHIHAGHRWLLKKAKRFGYLVVVIANDKHNYRTYALPAKQRKKNIEKLGIANRIIVGSSNSFVLTVKKINPNVIVLGHDQKLPPHVSDYVKKQKIAIIRFSKHGSYSTRNLVK